jgi:hypothetical protein
LPRSARVAPVHQQREDRGVGNEFVQQSQPFGAQFSAEPAHSGDVLARTVEAGDETGVDRIAAEYENDWDRRRRRLNRERAVTDRDDHGRLPFDQVRGQRWQPSKLPLTPAEDDLNVLAVDMTVSPRPWWNAATRCADSPGDLLVRNPITRISDCCARADSGHAAEPPSSVMNWRRFTRSPRRQA